MNLGVSVFEAFSDAIVSKRYSIGKYQRGSLVGNVFDYKGALDVIVDDGDYTEINNAPNAAGITSDILMYVRPEQLPTFSTRKLASDYLIFDSDENDYYAIKRANIGKNQQRGEIEHVELELVQTEVAL